MEIEQDFLIFNRLDIDYSIRNSCLTINVIHRYAARKLLKEKKELFINIALLFRCDRVRIYYGTQDFYEILTTMPQPLTIEQELWMDRDFRCLNIELIKIAERMVKSPYSMALIRMSDDRQIWVNDRNLEIAKVDAEEAVQRNMKDFWRSRDLSELHERLERDRDFDHRYEAALSPRQWAKFYSHFELLFEGQYRLTTLYEVEETTPPDDAPIPIAC